MDKTTPPLERQASKKILPIVLPETTNYVIIFLKKILLSFQFFQVFRLLRPTKRDYLHFFFIQIIFNKETILEKLCVYNEDFKKSVISPTYRMDGSPRTSTGALTKKS